MRVLVCGGRTFSDRHRLYEALNALDPRPTLIIEGGQRTKEAGQIVGGADFFAKEWADRRGIPVLTVDAEWQRYGKSAGPLRNAKMISFGRPDLVLATDGGAGTNDMVRQACNANIKVIKVNATESS